MEGTNKPKRVMILGGGMASLAAAVALTQLPDFNRRFRVTVYQLGWRLGGKCASGRNPQAAVGRRIEEHGLHVWFGCYDAAFALLRTCLRALGREEQLALLFDGKDCTPYMEDAGGWKVWPVCFPRRSGGLGDASFSSNAVRYFKEAWKHTDVAIRDLMEAARLHILEIPDAVDEAIVTLLGQMQGLVNEFSLENARNDAYVGDVTATIAGLRNAIGHLQAVAITPLLAKHQVTALSDTFRRTRILADLGLAVASGTVADRLASRGYESIDDVDFRVWLERHGASTETRDAAPVRALYDLCFAYEDGVTEWRNANFAAGTALLTVLRIGLDYHRHVVYEMRAGMGEAVIAPIFEYLKQCGVRFEFFHRVEQIELDGDGTRVSRVLMARQAKAIRDEYEPLVNDGPTPGDGRPRLPFWPSMPKLELLEDGERLRDLDLESHWSHRKFERPVALHAGADFDHVIMGLSLESVKRVCESFVPSGRTLPAHLERWTRMFATMRSVQTVGVQLWMTKRLEELGWVHGSVPVDAAPEPLDVWADRTDLLAYERWSTPVPRSLHFLCGPLAGDFLGQRPNDPGVPGDARNLASRVTEEWLTVFARHLWPNAVRNQAFDWEVLFDPGSRTGAGRLGAQFIKPNIDPSERYVLSIAGSTKYRLAPDASGIANLSLAGDWTRTDWNAGCVESAVRSGLLAAAHAARA